MRETVLRFRRLCWCAVMRSFCGAAKCPIRREVQSFRLTVVIMLSEVNSSPDAPAYKFEPNWPGIEEFSSSEASDVVAFLVAALVFPTATG